MTEVDLRQEIEDALNVLGTGNCPCQACPGCEYETKAVIHDLTLALAKLDDEVCPRCKGECHELAKEQPPSGRPVMYDLCPECEGRGTTPGYRWRVHSEHYREWAHMTTAAGGGTRDD
jgi:hypothetical protein